MLSADRYSAWTRQKTTLFSGHYLLNRSTLDIGVLGYIGIVQHKEHPPEVWHIPPGTPCIHLLVQINITTYCLLPCTKRNVLTIAKKIKVIGKIM